MKRLNISKKEKTTFAKINNLTIYFVNYKFSSCSGNTCSVRSVIYDLPLFESNLHTISSAEIKIVNL